MTRNYKFRISSAERWINCPASVKLEEGLPSTTSFEAMEGTQAAELVDRCLKNRKKAGILPADDKWDLDIDKIPNNYNQDMKEYAVNFISWLKPLLAECREWQSEVQIPLIKDKVGGTPDVIGIKHDGNILVVDGKYGIGKYVPAFNNIQIALYGVAAGLHMAGYKAVTFNIEGYIYQGRYHGYDFPAEGWTIKPAQIFTLVHAMQRAIKAAEAPEKTAPKPGPWCQWCKAIGICPAYGELSKEIIDVTGAFPEAKLESLTAKVEKLSVEELAFIHRNSDFISKFLKEVDIRLLNLASENVELPGLKVVEGRSNRTWDTSKIEEIKTKKELYETPAPALKTLGALEKEFGKKAFADTYGHLLTKPAGKPKLVPAEAPGEPYNFGNSAIDDFSDVIN